MLRLKSIWEKFRHVLLSLGLVLRSYNHNLIELVNDSTAKYWLLEFLAIHTDNLWASKGNNVRKR